MNTLRVPLNLRILVTLCLGLLWIVATRAPSGPVLVPFTQRNELPDVVMHDVSGHRVSTTAQQGHPTIYTVWTSWCPTCRAAMPFWERNAAAFADEGVQVVAVNHREDLAVVASASASFPAGLTVWADPDGAFLATLQSTDLPTTAFVDRTGRVVAVVRGPVSQSVALRLVSDIASP